MHTDYFDPVKTTLYKGTNLIEASAGTGKTYTIAMLALRFVVEENISLEKLLVVTFTKAATEELKERIRTRLVEAKRAVTGNTTGIDSAIINWLQKLTLSTECITQRLDTALLSIDQASIFTIHGFCQRVLQERPLESGQLFSSELSSDIQAIKQQCADDFWRRVIYPRSVWEAAILTATYNTPETLLASVNGVPGHISVYPERQDLDAVLDDLKKCVQAANTAWQSAITVLHDSFAQDTFKSSYVTDFDTLANQLKTWLQGDSQHLPPQEALALLTENGLKEALNGHKFRTTKTQRGDGRKQEYLASLNINTLPFDQLTANIALIPITLRRNLVDYLRTGVAHALQQDNVLSFDDLITRLADALQKENKAVLIDQLRSCFSVALIDEFQDTDDNQWLIFSRIFAAPSQYLYLIGDPKQAIYKFRGADIYSYLGAQKTAEHRFTLTHNWRSHPHLVAAVNTLFRRHNAFFLADLPFTPVTPGLSAQQGYISKNGKAIAPTMLWQLPPSTTAKGYWTDGKAGAAIRQAFVTEIIQLLTHSYAIQPSGRPLQPKDIAILVRSNRQAREYQDALRIANVPSVLNSLESVFASQEAIDLYTLLRAIATPGDTSLFKQALSLDWFGMDGQAFHRFINDETVTDECMGRFFAYHQIWQKSGLMTMALQLMAQENIRSHLSTTLRAERQITNVHHLLELVQQAAVDHQFNITKTVDWLHHAITQSSNSDDKQLRLESDDNAVKIVTTHRSKGLEYNIVFCPYLWQRNNRESDVVICHEDNQMVADLGSKNLAQRRLQAQDEELAEDLRVLYVAITRAKYRCYITWADVRTEKSPNQSALAWLLECADADFAEQQTKLTAYSTEFAEIFDYQLLNLSETPQARYQKPVESLSLHAKQRQRSLYTFWQMSSYTALSALTTQTVPEFPEDKANEQPEHVEFSQPLLPRGVQTGNAVHDLLENNHFNQLAQPTHLSVQTTKTCLRYGLKVEHAALLNELLQTVVTTPLSTTDSHFCLMNLSNRHCLKEMPFYLSLSTLDTAAINAILADCQTFQPLDNHRMAGFLTGFIDLVCEYQGRYYIIDYKTNTLPDYSDASLLEAMREHNYGLQYWLYTVVLHRYLQMRLPNYHYQQHVGGVLYLFVRGMQADIAMSGVFQDTPEYEKLNALSSLFFRS